MGSVSTGYPHMPCGSRIVFTIDFLSRLQTGEEVKDERAGQYGAFGFPAIGCAVQDVPLGDQHAPSLLDECRMICAVGCRAVMSVNVRMVAMPSQAAMPFTSTWRSAVLAASS